MRRLLAVTAIAAGALLLGPAGAAHASCQKLHQTNGNNYGFLNGTQVAVPVDSAVSITGLALGLLGYANADGTTKVRNNCH